MPAVTLAGGIDQAAQLFARGRAACPRLLHSGPMPRLPFRWLYVPAVAAVACRTDAPFVPEPTAPSPADTLASMPAPPQARLADDILRPREAFGQLFIDVQMGEVFEDSKTFVDMIPRTTPAEILAAYEARKRDDTFDLGLFVAEYFEAPKQYAKDFTTDADFDLDQHIERLWPVLTRDEERQAGGSLIPLPNDYVVPGGRFREVYYWDTYFTMLGLLVDGQEEYARRMVDNFAFLIDAVGFVPNGNRSYYLSRSQPPFFAPMVGLLAESGGDTVIRRYLPQLEREYAFWMRGAERLEQRGDRTERVARIAGDFTVNRYFDADPRPRPEGFAEDSLTASRHPERDAAELYRDLRAAAESGWDFSSRWLADPEDLGTIRTTMLAPVDLNSLLFYLEDILARGYEITGDATRQQHFARASYERRRALLTKFFNPSAQWFLDYDLERGAVSPEATLAGLFPLFFGVATEDQAAAVAERLERDFLRPGGLVTTLRDVEQQWDAPNGWAPLHWVAIKGLRDYGHEELAREIADRWLSAGRRVYRETGKVVEKYNVVDTTLLAGGGEYENQDGFGWSNGVFARIIEDYPGL